MYFICFLKSTLLPAILTNSPWIYELLVQFREIQIDYLSGLCLVLERTILMECKMYGTVVRRDKGQSIGLPGLIVYLLN